MFKKVEKQWDFASQARGLTSIEFLVNNICLRHLSLMSDSGLRWQVRSQEQYFRDRILINLPSILELYQPGYVYSELIEAFWVACQQVGLLDADGQTELATGSPIDVGIARNAAIDAVIGLLPDLVMSAEYQRRACDRRYESHEKSAETERYVQAVMERYSKSLVIRLDLGFRKDAQPDVTVDTLYAAVDGFMAMRNRGHPLFDHLTGYVLNLEQGIERGFHSHVGLIYNGNEVWSESYRGELARALWAECTGGMGTVYLCNANKAEYERRNCCGIGMVERNDFGKRGHVVSALQYMADADKEDQYLRIRPVGQRSFRKGRMSTESIRFNAPLGSRCMVPVATKSKK